MPGVINGVNLRGTRFIRMVNDADDALPRRVRGCRQERHGMERTALRPRRRGGRGSEV